LGTPGANVNKESYPNARLSVGYSHACLVKNDGFVTCWNTYDAPKETCQDVTENPSSPLMGPQSVPECGQSKPPPGKFVEVACGILHTCALRVDGTVDCWGLNNRHQLQVPQANRFVHIRSWGYDTCGVTREGSVECWGQHAFTANTNDWIIANVGPTGERAVAQSGQQGAIGPTTGVCGFKGKDRERVCVSWNQTYRNTREKHLIDGIEGRSVAVENDEPITYDCGIRIDGTLNCLPWNWIAPSGKYRQLTRLRALGNPCALNEDGTVVCFARSDDDFPFADHTYYASTMIRSTPLEGSFEEIAADQFGLCGRTRDDIVRCIDQRGATFSSDREPLWNH
jgi:hypothetical protein